MNSLSRRYINRSTNSPNILILWLFISCSLVSCTPIDKASNGKPTKTPSISPTENACRITEPVWAKPPIDSAVQDEPVYGYYYLNEDRSIWASAWWATEEYESYLRSGNEGVKVGWFRPEGADMEITSQRLDAPVPPLDADIPCCYSTRFQATGLIFPAVGCWEITAKAADKILSFIIQVDP